MGPAPVLQALRTARVAVLQALVVVLLARPALTAPGGSAAEDRECRRLQGAAALGSCRVLPDALASLRRWW